ncbi:MAG: outer membrane beta-barrel protein [Chloroflexia bacterium]|nr:outer membrane beta-barrel protein [Chloroflexia bacterium]
MIKGYVISSTDHKPAEFANVILMQLPDSTFQSGVITYTEGDYTIENVKPGKYFIKSSFVGFEDNGTEIEITGDKEVFIADTIYLSENTKELGEVAVKGDMIRSTELVDRTVYTIPPEIAKTSTNGFEVLRKIPSVQVDFNNNVTLNGKSNFIIQVDGKQRDKEFLARLMPEDIQSVEVIHNPGAKYDGTIDGVINIVLTKEARIGISGNVAGMIRPAEDPSGYVAGGIDYGREKITFYASGYTFFQGLNNRTTNFNRFLGNGAPDSTINNEGNGDFGIVASSINTGFDYYLNEKNKLSLNVNYKPTTFLNNLENIGKIHDGNSIAHNQYYQSDNETRSDEVNISLFYKKEFEKPIQELTIETSAYLFNSLDKKKFNSRLEQTDGTLVYSYPYNENVNNDRNYLSAKVDYVHPLGNKIRIETGYQFYFQKMKYDFLNSIDVLSNLYEYTEYRNAAYAGFILNLEKYSFQASFRTEYSDIEVNKEIKNDYYTFLPSANIQYKINKSNNLKFTY